MGSGWVGWRFGGLWGWEGPLWEVSSWPDGPLSGVVRVLLTWQKRLQDLTGPRQGIQVATVPPDQLEKRWAIWHSDENDTLFFCCCCFVLSCQCLATNAQANQGIQLMKLAENLLVALRYSWSLWSKVERHLHAWCGELCVTSWVSAQNKKGLLYKIKKKYRQILIHLQLNVTLYPNYLYIFLLHDIIH